MDIRDYLNVVFGEPPELVRAEDLYLAHPFETRKWVREWELDFERGSGINLFNPFYDGEERTDVERADLDRTIRYEQLDPNELIPRDVGNIDSNEEGCRRDGIISLVTGDLSYGTIMEIVYSRLLMIPVLSVVTNGHENHPWLKFHSTEMFTDLKGLERFLIDFRRKSG
jgi:hypothetical protein